MAGLKEFPVTKENPFTLIGLDTKVIIPYKSSNVAVNRDTGELFELNPFLEQKTVTVDLPTFTKIYHKSLPTVKDFSNSALKVYCYILNNIRINSDEIYMYMGELKEFTGYRTTANIYKGITELLEKQFIARATGSTEKYWVNANFLFNGKRQKLLK